MPTFNGTDAGEYLQGGAENDTLIGGGGADTLDGGGGWNVVAYWSSNGPVGVQLGRGLTSMDGFNASDVLLNIHGVFGSRFGDVLLGSDFSDLLAGLGGDDTIEGLGGDDALTGYAGNDMIDGGAGIDTAYFGGKRGDYAVTAIDGGFTVTHNSTFLDFGTEVNEGTDTVTQVERFSFADGVFDAATITDPLAPPTVPVTPPTDPTPPTTPTVPTTPTTPSDPGTGALPVVRGTAGDDRFGWTPGQHAYEGLGGRDTLDLGGLGFRRADVGTQADGSVVVTHGGDMAVLRGVEEVRFADGRLVFDAADPAAQVARLYEAALDRLPDQGGLNFWIDAVQHGQPLSGLASGFLGSGEFASRFGDVSSDGAFVDRLYLNVLDRAGEAAGRDFWVGTLNAGTSRADVLVAFSESAENKAGTAALVQDGIWDRSEAATQVARLYDTVLGRAPDMGGLAFWKGALEGGTATLGQMADSFAGSSEFLGKYGALGNRDFANALYVNTLDRAADRAGLDHWTGVLNSGVGRAEVVLAFSESAEHVNLTAHAIQSENPGDFGILFA